MVASCENLVSIHNKKLLLCIKFSANIDGLIMTNDGADYGCSHAVD